MTLFFWFLLYGLTLGENFRMPVPALDSWSLTEADLGRGYDIRAFDPSQSLKPQIVTFETVRTPDSRTHTNSEQTSSQTETNKKLDVSITLDLALLRIGGTFVDNKRKNTYVTNIMAQLYEQAEVVSFKKTELAERAQSLIGNAAALEKMFGTHVITKLFLGRSLVGYFTFLKEHSSHEADLRVSIEVNMGLFWVGTEIKLFGGTSYSDISEGEYQVVTATSSKPAVKTTDLQSALDAFNAVIRDRSSMKAVVGYLVEPLSNILNVGSLSEYALRRVLYNTESFLELGTNLKSKKIALIEEFEETILKYAEWIRSLDVGIERLKEQYIDGQIQPYLTRAHQFIRVLEYWQLEYIVALEDRDLNITDMVELQASQEVDHFETVFMGFKGLGTVEGDLWTYDGYIVDGFPVLEGTWADSTNYHDQQMDKYLVLQAPLTSDCDFKDYEFHEQYHSLFDDFCTESLNFENARKTDFTYNTTSGDGGYPSEVARSSHMVSLDEIVCGGRTQLDCSFQTDCEYKGCACRRKFTKNSLIGARVKSLTCKNYGDDQSCLLRGCYWVGWCTDKITPSYNPTVAPSVAEEIACSCNTPNSGSEGYNEMTCTNGETRSCEATEICSATQPFPYGEWSDGCTEEVVCTCTTPNSGTVGHNQITCTNNDILYCASTDVCDATESFKHGEWTSACSLCPALLDEASCHANSCAWAIDQCMRPCDFKLHAFLSGTLIGSEVSVESVGECGEQCLQTGQCQNAMFHNYSCRLFSSEVTETYSDNSVGILC